MFIPDVKSIVKLRVKNILPDFFTIVVYHAWGCQVIFYVMYMENLFSKLGTILDNQFRWSLEDRVNKSYVSVSLINCLEGHNYNMICCLNFRSEFRSVSQWIQLGVQLWSVVGSPLRVATPPRWLQLSARPLSHQRPRILEPFFLPRLGRGKPSCFVYKIGQLITKLNF